MTRLIFGEKVHMRSSSIRVPLPRSFCGAVTRTRESFSPCDQDSIDIDRSQSGRWIVIVISPWDERPRQ